MARSSTEYRPFASLPPKNAIQESLEVPTLARALKLPRGGRVLEVGCGRGVALGPLAALLAPRRLVGLDLDAGALRVARAAPAELVHGDVRALPFDDASFDLVVDFGTCYHIARPGDALREVARVLAPRGLFAHETKVAQLLAHPARSVGRSLPWNEAPTLVPARFAIFWATRERV